MWQIPAAVLGTAVGLVLLLLIAAACVVAIPSWRTAVLQKGLTVASERTGMDISVERLYLSPFHHSPMVLYRAWKGKEDLPLQVEVDSLFVGHRGQDTLVYAEALRLGATVLTAGRIQDDSVKLTSLPIVVDQLLLRKPTFHSDSLIAAVGVDVVASLLDASSPGLVLSEGQFPLNHLRLTDAFVGIDLRPTPPDTTAKDTSASSSPMAFDIADADLENIHFALTPTALYVDVDRLATNVLVDVGGSLYDVRRIDAGRPSLRVGNLVLPFDTLYGDARVDLENHLITSRGLHAVSSPLGAKADLSTTALDLETMRVDVVGDADFRGSMARLRGYYDIDDEAYDMNVQVEKVNLTPFLKDSVHALVAGEIAAVGQGIDLKSPAIRSHVKAHLTDAVYNQFNASGLMLDAQLAGKTVSGTLHLPFAMSGDSLRASAQTEHQFRVTDFLNTNKMRVDYHTQMRRVRAFVAGQHLQADALALDFRTDDSTALDLSTDGLNAQLASPMHVMALVNGVQPLLKAVGDSAVMKPLLSLHDLTMLDTLRRLIPDLQADIALAHGSMLQPFIDRTGLDIRQVALSLTSDSEQMALALDAAIPEISHPDDSTALRLPPAQAALRVHLTEGQTSASLDAGSRLTDGAMKLHDLQTDAALRLDLERNERLLSGVGQLTLDDLSFKQMDFGRRTADLLISPSEQYAGALRADVRLDDIPLNLVDSILKMADVDLHGAIRAKASIDGLPDATDISAEVRPLGVSADYKPYQVTLGLGETPIIMEHNHVDFNHLPIYGVDSTFIALTGGLDLNSMRLDVTLAGDSFAPARLVKDGPIPVYGDLAADVRGTVTGPLDSILADVNVTILPSTDITYPIDKKNLAQVRPYGTVNVRYGLAEKQLGLGGVIHVDDGTIRYSPKAYPIMPFQVDSGSQVTFNGSLGQTLLAVSASQKVKADVESNDEETRRVDFTTGVRVNGVLDSLGLKTIGFFLEAPQDETITRELASLDEETREGIAATLLATGMYVGESNVAAQRSGYALSSIINSRINAAMANSKMGKVIDIDISSGQSKHAAGKTNDMNITLSKSFLDDRLRITLGSSISDNPDVNTANGLLRSLEASYKITKSGNVLLRAFSQRDYHNIFEGELYKSGLGVRAIKEWHHRQSFRGDSINRTYGLTADADVAYRSNNSIGPNLTLTSTIRNLLGGDETFSVKGNGAYYWALRDRHPGDPKRTDTYKLGVNASLLFPYLHWGSGEHPEGDTRYMVGYQYENIAGGYGVHKVSGSFTYFFHKSGFVTHAFTPFSLSMVRVKAESADLLDKMNEYPQLIQVLCSDEFVPAVAYNFIYNDYRDKRAVNTMLDLGVKESGNLLNAIYCAFGHKWDELDKPLGKKSFNQFVKLQAELRNKFNLTDKVCIATRLFAGANIPLGNSLLSPLSEAFYAGGPNSLRASAPYAYGPGNFYSAKYNQNFFHAGDVKLEANFELRFPIVWKLYGATFVDAGNVWNWYSTRDLYQAAGMSDYMERLQLPEDLEDGIIGNPHLAKQIALGTGAGLRLDFDGLVVRFDLGVAIHAPYQTYKYDKDGKPDPSKPINTYYNIPSVLDGLRLNFGIGYPF